MLPLTLWACLPAFASYGIFVGSDLTGDGSVFLGGSGDEVSSHWLEIVPARQHPEGATITVGVDRTAFLPGELTEIPQVARTARYLTMNYTEYDGFRYCAVPALPAWGFRHTRAVRKTPLPDQE